MTTPPPEGTTTNPAADEGRHDEPRHGSAEVMFASALAPDVSISALNVFRATLTFEPESETENQSILWRISGMPGDEERFGSESRFFLIGDLAGRHEGWFVGATVIASLSFRNPDAYDFVAQQEELVQGLGPWATNLLYDVAAGAARGLVAQSHNCDVELPVGTPPLEIISTVD